MTRLSIIVAMGKNRVIGNKNTLPWHIPEELQHFKQMTMGKPIIMGRKTFDAIGRRLLPGRKTIIMTRDQELTENGFNVVHSVNEALAVAGSVPEVMIVGGAGVYQEFLPIVDRVYLSIIPQEFVGDAFFPELDLNKWHLDTEVQHTKFVVQTFSRIK